MKRLKVLILEDQLGDAELVKYHVSTMDFECEFKWVKNEREFLKALKEFTPHVILSDYKLDGYDGLRALEYCKEHLPNIPFIMVTGTLGEELAVKVMKQGVTDFLLKGRITELPQAITRALREAEETKAKQQAEADLQVTLEYLEDLVIDRTHELEMAKGKLERQHKEILDSINYAKNIQNAFIPPIRASKLKLADAFVLDMPKDTLSGDFQWSYYSRAHQCSYIAVGDCTGHGVPGSLMTMLAIQMLEQHICNLDSKKNPSDLLKAIDESMVGFLNQRKSGNTVHDGMEVVLIRVDHAEKVLHFSSAGRPVYLFQHGQLNSYKQSKVAVGGFVAGVEKHFQQDSFSFAQGDRMYVFSDGFADQFGGENNAKLLRKRKDTFLSTIQSEPFADHAELLNQFFLSWKGDNFQVDDVIAVGLEF